MATITAKQLGQAEITASPTTLYTVPALTTAFLKSFDVCNTGASQRKLRVFLVPTGHSADTGHALIYDLLIPPNGCFGWEGEQVLAAAATIQIAVMG